MVNEWLEVINLALNVMKTKYMIFSKPGLQVPAYHA